MRKLVVDRAGDPHPEVEVLPGPAGGHELVVEDQQVGLGEILDEAVAHHPVGVVLVDQEQVDPASVPDRPPLGETRSVSAAVGSGIWMSKSVSTRTGQNRSATGAQPGSGRGAADRRPARSRPARRPRKFVVLPLSLHGPLERREGQGEHDLAVPLPHAREVVDGQTVPQGPVEVEA